MKQDIEGIGALRIVYFLTIGAGGFVFPFLSLFYTRRGLTGTQIGVISTVAALVALVAAPIWGRWMDAAEDPRRVLRWSMIGGIAYYLLLVLQNRFWAMLVLAGVGSFAVSAIFSLSDSMTMRLIQRVGYGSIRLWGSLGWAVTVLLAGVVIDRFGIEMSFPGYALTMLGAVIMLGLVPNPQQAGALPHLPRAKGAPIDLLRMVMSRPALIGLVLMVGLNMLTAGLLFQFTMVYLEDLGASDILISVAAMLSAVVELPMMLAADRVLRHFRPVWALVGWAGVMVITRLVVVLIPSVWTVLLSRGLDGVSYSLLAVGLVMYIKRHAPEGKVATLMALFAVTLPGLVQMGASPLQGWLYDLGGGGWLFITALIGAVMILAVGLWTAVVTRGGREGV